MDSVLLKAQELSYSYHTLNGETPALDRVSFCLYRKEFLAIVGPSGCGKSTILSLIAGRHRRRTSAENFPKARRFRLSRLFKPRAAFSQFQRPCSIRTQRCDSHRKQHGKGVLRCLGGIPEGAGITSKSCPYGSSFSWHLISQN